mgnify:CR=1 FL=1
MYYFVILNIFFSSLLFSQTTLRGFVTNKKTTEKLQGVSIFINNTFITTTNHNGFFSCPLSTDSTNIEVRLLGYKTIQKNIIIENKKIIDVFFPLEEQTIELDPISITAKKNETTVHTIATQHISLQELKNTPSLGEPDPVHIAQMVPGVTAATSALFSQIYVRGGNFDETLIALDNIPIYNPYHFSGIFGAINSDIVYDETLYLSNYPVNFGEHLSGILSLNTKNDIASFYKGSASLGLVSSKAYLEGPFGKGKFIIAGKKTYIDMIAKAFVQEDPYYFYDLFAKLSLPISEKNTLNFSSFYSRDYYNPFFKKSIDEYEPIRWGNKIYNAVWKHTNENFTIAGNLYYTNASLGGNGRNYSIFYEKNLNDVLQSLSITNSITEYGAKAEATVQLSHHSILVGIESKKQILDYNWDIHWESFSDGESLFLPKPSSFFDYADDTFFYNTKTQLHTFYIADEIQPREDVSLIVGARTSYLQSLDRTLFSPFLKAHYHYSPELSFYAGFGTYFQHLFVLKEDRDGYGIFAPYTIYFLAKNKKELGISEHYLAALQWNPNNDISLLVEGYFKNRKNIASTYNIINNKYRFEDGYSTGIDMTLKKYEGMFQGWISYSLARTIKDNGNYLYFAHYDRTHTFKMYGTVQIADFLTFNSFWTYSSGVPYTGTLGKFVKEEEVFFWWDSVHTQYSWQSIKGQKNFSRVFPYHRWDIGVTGNFIWGNVLVIPYIHIFNMYDPIASVFKLPIAEAPFPFPTFGVTVEF